MSGHEAQRIEEQIAHLARTVDELSDIVREQGIELVRLQRLVGQLAEREAEREVAGGGTIPLADQRPPHW